MTTGRTPCVAINEVGTAQIRRSSTERDGFPAFHPVCLSSSPTPTLLVVSEEAEQSNNYHQRER